MDPRQRVVLVVDDDPDFRHLVRSILVDEGYRVHAAANGAAALEVLRLDRPDAILLDVRMPVMGGWAFRAAQLALPEARHIPVLLMTAGSLAEPPSPELAPTAALPKPFDVAQLLTALANAVGAGAPAASARPGALPAHRSAL